MSLSFLYWMQTEAPNTMGHAARDEQGFPGLRLRPDIVGTAGGLAKSIYVRESRRIQAQFTVLEQHLGVRGPRRAHRRAGIPRQRGHWQLPHRPAP